VVLSGIALTWAALAAANARARQMEPRFLQRLVGKYFLNRGGHGGKQYGSLEQERGVLAVIGPPAIS
jgi:hypothetical protein